MSAEASSPTVKSVWVTAQPVQANMANLSFGNAATLDSYGESFQAIMNGEQHHSTAPVTANIWAAPPPTGNLGHHPGFNIAAGTQAMGAYVPILLQGRTPYGRGKLSLENTATLDGHIESFQAIMNSEQHHSTAPVTANIWADPLSTDTLGHHPSFNTAAGTQAMAAYDLMSPAYMPMPSVFPGSFQQLPKEIQTQQIEIMLTSLRQSGVQFAEISNMIKAKFGVEMSVNSLVKRFGKLRNLYLGVSRLNLEPWGWRSQLLTFLFHSHFPRP
jgi:hypothetical protein